MKHILDVSKKTEGKTLKKQAHLAQQIKNEVNPRKSKTDLL